MRYVTRALGSWLVVSATCLASAAAANAAETPDGALRDHAARHGYPERVPVAPVDAKWKFSSDAGKTHSLDSLPPVASRARAPVSARGEFTVDDPARIGVLWVTTDSPIGGMSPVTEQEIGPKYVSRVPVLLNARIAVNGTPVAPEADDTMLYARYGIDPALLRKGNNVITLTGDYWNSWGNMEQNHEVTVGFRLMTSPPDALELRSGPVLGPIGEDYFTFMCRTHIPCELAVKVRPTEPAGEEHEYAVKRGSLHRVRVELPKGTRKFQYSVVAKNGTFTRADGPYDVKVPRAAEGLRWVVLGQTAANPGQTEGLSKAAEALLKLDPDFIIHTGSIVKMAYWDFEWDESFFRPWKQLLARIPICAVPAYRDDYSAAWTRLLYKPSDDPNWLNWTYAAGNVRFIGLDGLWSAEHTDAVTKWLEDILKAAREDYVFTVTAYPGFVARPFGRGIKGHDYDKKTVHPLLVKYAATASLGCTGAYEYADPPAGQGVPTVITGGVGAEMSPGWNTYHYCVFEIKDGKCRMQAVGYETGKVLDNRTFSPRSR